MQNEIEYQQITGVVEDVVFYNTENSFTVLDVSSGGELITAVGILPEITAGEKVVLTGTWDMHQSFGRQFRVNRFERYLPDTAAQFLKYLSSGAIKGVGPKTATQMVERFGDNTFNVIENEPERLTVLRGISKDKAKLISAEFKKQFAVRTVILGLEKYGLTPSECIRIFKELGVNAVDIIKENPYVLCTQTQIISFERTEKIASELESAPEPKHRLRAGITHIIRYNLFNGHTCLPMKKVVPLCCELLGVEETDVNSAIAEMITNKMLIPFEMKEKVFLSLPDVYKAESTIDEKIKQLMRFSASDMDATEQDLERIEKENNITYEEKQKEAIKLAAHGGMLVLTGGPGTGKTTVVKGIINFFEKKRMEIMLAAPTGRAAKRMSELTGYEAKTIHRLLEVEWTDGRKLDFKRNKLNPLEADVIILDEVSMVDIFLFSHFLDAVRFGCRVILVGDPDQLPAVDAGNVLGDIIASQKVPVVRLTEIFRQSGESLIVTNAHAVIDGREPVLDAKDNDFFFMNRDNPILAAQTVSQLCSERLPRAYGYSHLENIQVLCPSRKGDCGTINLNRQLQNVLNPASDKKKECKIAGRLFREGDKVMQIKNNYDIPWERGRESGSGLFNGDIGIIQEINVKSECMRIIFDDDREVVYPIPSGAELELAYAVTVHKSQAVNTIVLLCPYQMFRPCFFTEIFFIRQ